jgi:hypothetical protein
MFARVPLHPLDTLKAKLQVQQHFRAGLMGTKLPAATAAGQVPSAAAQPVSPAPASSVASTPRGSTLLSLTRHTVRAEGFRGLYAGFPVTFFGSAPAACIYFTTYETSKNFLSSHPAFSGGHKSDATGGAPSPFLAHFASGLIAEAAACILWVPVDVVKERLQVQQQLKEMLAAAASPGRTAAAASAEAAGRAAAVATGAPLASSLGPLLPSAAPLPPAALYRGTLDAIVTIARIEGVRGVYRGYGATLASFGPFSAIYFSGYEQCKSMLLARMHPDHEGRVRAARLAGHAPPLEPELGFFAYAFCGGLAGSVATILTNPLDLVKLRMQVQRAGGGGGGGGGAATATASSVGPHPTPLPPAVPRTTLHFGYRNVVHGLRTLVAQEGPQALFKGAGVRCLFHIPSTAITIATVDTLRQHITRIRTRMEQRGEQGDRARKLRDL